MPDKALYSFQPDDTTFIRPLRMFQTALPATHMQIRKNLSEISDMLSRQSGKSITVHQTEPNRIRLHYLAAIDLTLSGHSEESLQFHYHLGWGANLLAKGVTGLLGNIQTRKISLDATGQIIHLHLNAFGEFKHLFLSHKIVAAAIEQSELVVDFAEK